MKDFLFGALVMLLVCLWLYDKTLKPDGKRELHIHVTHTGGGGIKSLLDAIQDGDMIAYYDIEQDKYFAVPKDLYTPDMGRQVNAEELLAFFEEGDDDDES